MSKRSSELGQEQRDFNSSTDKPDVGLPEILWQRPEWSKKTALSRCSTGQLEGHKNIWKAQLPSLRSEWGNVQRGLKLWDLSALTKYSFSAHSSGSSTTVCHSRGPWTGTVVCSYHLLPEPEFTTHTFQEAWQTSGVTSPSTPLWHMGMPRACQIIGKVIMLVAHTFLALLEWGSLGPPKVSFPVIRTYTGVRRKQKHPANPDVRSLAKSRG